ncbi:alpha/beta hydrolase family protein [Aquimarina sp. W85]|uniref:alpha/beta hydrolase family protein n=1 Tax=Aquimarina rhodophyticola TaxID=3342246 RepID=UPI003670C00B
MVIGWGLPYVLPVFTLPEPTGKHKVGTQYIHLKTNQFETLTPLADDMRELMIKVWYPAQLSNEIKETYLNEGDRLGFAKKCGLPEATFDYLDRVTTHTYSYPEVALGSFPVLIFSPGIYANASGYYALIEEIVSNGYIVLNINHTYESTGSLFPDGEIKLYGTEYDKKHNNQKMDEMVWLAMQNYKKASSSDEQYGAIEELIRNYIAAEITLRWSNDISLTLDELEKLNTSSFLANHINISKIGVFGHSQGGAAAGQALLDDNRIQAGINLDGVQWGPMIDTLLTKPFALISSAWDSNHPDFNTHIYHNGSLSDFYNVKIINSGHSSFMDIPLMINVPLLNEAGTIDPIKGYKISTEIILQFFDKYLNDHSLDLLKLNDRHPELEMELLEKTP